MEILYVLNNQQVSDNSVATAICKMGQSNDSEVVDALLKNKLISAVKEENKDAVKSVLGEIFNASDIFLELWDWHSHHKKQERRFEIWRDAMYMAMEGDTNLSGEIMKLFLDSDIICSLDTKMNDLLLHRLIPRAKNVEDKKLRLIEMLLKSGEINVNARDDRGKTALQYAHEEKLITLLISYGADVNKKDKIGMTPVMNEWSERVSELRSILKVARNLVDLDAIDCIGRTALMTAASHLCPDTVDLLLNAGASVNVSDYLGFTALHHALYTRFDHYDHFPRNSEELKKRKEIFTILFDAKEEDVEVCHERCDLDREFKKRKEQRMKIIEMLLQIPDIDVNALTFENLSPLDMVEGWIPQLPSSIKNALKEKGAVLNVFRKTETQSSSRFYLDVRCRLSLQQQFGYACGHTPDGQYLPEDLFERRLLTLIEEFQGQIVTGKDQQGRTALHLVALSLSITWAAVYWSFGVDWNCQNYERDLANTIVNKLITMGCNVNETDIYGRTPLHYANFILKDSLISHGADALIKDKDGNSAIDEIPQQSSIKAHDIVKAVIDESDETYILRLMNNKQSEIEVQRVDSQVREYDDRECWLKTVPRLLWEKGEYAFRHSLFEKITKEVIYLMSIIAKEIERLDPRFEIRHESVGSSNEETKIGDPNEFDFCFVLTKISEICEVSQSPELPTAFVRLKRKPKKVAETSDFDSFFGKDEILNTEKLNWQFATILSKALVNIESQQSLDWNLELPDREFSAAVKKTSNIVMIKRLNFTSGDYISVDIVPCIHVDGWWPDEAISNVSDEIKTFGCNLVFDRPQKLYPWVPYSVSCARISFSKAESDMIKQSCDNAKEALMIGKTMIEESRSASNYCLKNCLLYCIEALMPTSEKASQLGLSIKELESKFHQMDRYLWLKCLMKCHLEFASQDFCPCYFVPNFCSPIGENWLKYNSSKWITLDFDTFPTLCRNSYAFYRCTSNAISEFCCPVQTLDLLWERFDRNHLIANLCEIAYNNKLY